MLAPPIKVGIVGNGFSTKSFHQLPFILPNADLRVHAFLQRAPAPSSDPSSSRATGGDRWGHCTVDFPAARHYRTPEKFFADAEIELVVVCTPSMKSLCKARWRLGCMVCTS